MAIAIDSANAHLSSPGLPLALSASSILRGIDAVALNCLPLVWQQIAAREVTMGHDDPDFLIALARLFFTKGTDGSSEIFQQESQKASSFRAFCAKGVFETLDFFGNDFLTTAYPNFERSHQTAKAQDGAEALSE
ncbi:MAG: hypothetical protein ACR2FS_09845 [Phormidesmis sp.]